MGDASYLSQLIMARGLGATFIQTSSISVDANSAGNDPRAAVTMTPTDQSYGVIVFKVVFGSVLSQQFNCVISGLGARASTWTLGDEIIREGMPGWWYGTTAQPVTLTMENQDTGMGGTAMVTSYCLDIVTRSRMRDVVEMLRNMTGGVGDDVIHLPDGSR